MDETQLGGTSCEPDGSPGASSIAAYPRSEAPVSGPDYALPFTEGNVLGLRVVRIGYLALPSGRIVASDPYMLGLEVPPFGTQVPPGRYPVYIARGVDDRVAFALIRLSDRPVRRWEQRDFDGKRVPDGYELSYPVDTGLGSFTDAATADRVRKARADLVGESLDASRLNEQGWAEVCLAPELGGNLVAFESGLGDGRYPSYFGFSEAGEPVALVTDFLLVDPDELRR